MGNTKSNPPTGGPDLDDLPDVVRERIEIERRRLQKASGVLTCLVFSVNHDAEDVDPGDVASVAVELVDRAVSALDVVELTRGLKGRASPV